MGRRRILTRGALRTIGMALVVALSGAACSPSPGASDPALERLFRRLHQPIYGVYDLGLDRDAIHRHLEQSFRGEALTREYVEHFSALHRMTTERTAIRVLRVDYETVRVVERAPGHFRVDAEWSVGGIVTHQRHRHPRTNRYRAGYALEHGDDGWRIVHTRLRDMRRIRGFSWDDLDDLPKSGGGLMSPLDLLRGGMAEDVEALRRRRESNEP